MTQFLSRQRPKRARTVTAKEPARFARFEFDTTGRGA
jgi:hypothetical protein